MVRRSSLGEWRAAFHPQACRPRAGPRGAGSMPCRFVRQWTARAARGAAATGVRHLGRSISPVLHDAIDKEAQKLRTCNARGCVLRDLRGWELAMALHALQPNVRRRNGCVIGRGEPRCRFGPTEQGRLVRPICFASCAPKDVTEKMLTAARWSTPVPETLEIPAVERTAERTGPRESC